MNKPKQLKQLKNTRIVASVETTTRASANSRGYNAKWQRARLLFLRNNPLCAECLLKVYFTQAKVVDHITPHKGDERLFWDTGNWQSLCSSCHSRKTAASDGGFGNNVRAKECTKNKTKEVCV